MLLERLKKMLNASPQMPSSTVSVLNDSAANPPYGTRPDEALEMKAIYSLTVRYMSQSKVYLTPDIKIKDLARVLHTNRLYLSRTINICAGYNFSQFVNWFRVNEATTLMRKDKRLRMEEVAKLCGFNNQPTFNMAFKYHTGMTPTEYRNIGRPLLSGLSRRMEQAQL